MTSELRCAPPSSTRKRRPDRASLTFTLRAPARSGRSDRARPGTQLHLSDEGAGCSGVQGFPDCGWHEEARRKATKERCHGSSRAGGPNTNRSGWKWGAAVRGTSRRHPRFQPSDARGRTHEERRRAACGGVSQGVRMRRDGAGQQLDVPRVERSSLLARAARRGSQVGCEPLVRLSPSGVLHGVPKSQVLT